MEPVSGQDKPQEAEPAVVCPDCGKLCHTLKDLHLRGLRKHSDAYTTGINIRPPAGIPTRYKLSGNAPVPPKTTPILANMATVAYAQLAKEYSQILRYVAPTGRRLQQPLSQKM